MRKFDFKQTLFSFLVCTLAITSMVNAQSCFSSGACCSCAFGFSGPLCHNMTDFCTPSPSLNGGICTINITNIPSGFNCNCTSPFFGVTCALGGSSSSSAVLNTGQIIGIVIGVIAAVVIAFCAALNLRTSNPGQRHHRARGAV